MKFFTLFTLMLIALFVYTSAQRCTGMPRNPSCTGGRNEGRRGRRGRRCTPRNMWYYNGTLCEPLRYLGCGGNNNRWCSQAACNQRCRR